MQQIEINIIGTGEDATADINTTSYWWEGSAEMPFQIEVPYSREYALRKYVQEGSEILERKLLGYTWKSRDLMDIEEFKNSHDDEWIEKNVSWYNKQHYKSEAFKSNLGYYKGEFKFLRTVESIIDAEIFKNLIDIASKLNPYSLQEILSNKKLEDIDTCVNALSKLNFEVNNRVKSRPKIKEKYQSHELQKIAYSLGITELFIKELSAYKTWLFNLAFCSKLIDPINKELKVELSDLKILLNKETKKEFDSYFTDEDVNKCVNDIEEIKLPSAKKQHFIKFILGR